MSCGNCEIEPGVAFKKKSRLLNFLQTWVSFVVFLAIAAAAITGGIIALSYLSGVVSTFWLIVLIILFISFLAAILGTE
jgi:hypothetical protein